MKLKITTLIIIEGNQVENIYHSLEDNQDKAYQDLINQVNATYGDGGVLQFKNIKGIKNYFDSVTIETQELIPIGFKKYPTKQRNKMKKNQLLIDNLRTHIFQSLENLEELLEQEDINLRTLRIKELEISFTVTRRTKSEYLKSLDFWYNPLTNYKEYQIPLQK